MESVGGPLPLAELAELAACTARQVQRDFQALGISPVAYGRAVRSDAARAALKRAARVTDAASDAGYGSVRGFYEEVGRRLGMTPSEYSAGAPGLPLLWAATPSAIGLIIAVASPVGLCAVRIGSDEEALESQIRAEFAASSLSHEPDAMRDVLTALRALALGDTALELPLDVRGTAFQARVWQALRAIPAGETRTYSEIAEEIGSPSSVRAVAAACASNLVALAVPCHRVVRSDGSLAGYAWGLEVKQQLLDAEREQAQQRVALVGVGIDQGRGGRARVR
jgi:AraC family transcriptional regulator of adaptative response/methylated-DNA-[protein]-cysteine methyltransferase